MSRDLNNFYNAVLNQLETGNSFWFTKNAGLCHNLERWSMFVGMTGEDHYRLEREMRNSFESNALDRYFPFNRANEYFQEQYDETIYQNVKRLEWIKKHAN